MLITALASTAIIAGTPTDRPAPRVAHAAAPLSTTLAPVGAALHDEQAASSAELALFPTPGAFAMIVTAGAYAARRQRAD